MRKLFVITLGMLVAVPAFAMEMPTIYGKVNREIRMTKYEAKTTGAKEFQNIRSAGVSNSESRIGVKGEYKFSNHFAKYVIELGVQSSQASSAGRLRIRRSEAELGGFWGSVIVGQTYVAGAKLGLTLDPLSGTSAGLHAVDARAIDGQTYSYGIGHTYRSRKELIGYKSPKFNGVQFYTSIDNEDTNGDEAPAGRENAVWSNELTFEKKFGNIDFGVYGTYVNFAGSSYEDASVMGAGLKFAMNGFALTGMYTKFESKDPDTVASKGYEATQMMVTGKYTFLKDNTIAITYGKTENEDKDDTAGEEKDETSQLAFGYVRQLHKNVSVRATFAKVENKHNDATENLAEGHEYTTIALGTTLTF